jgi:hypothetical protein
MIFQLFRKIDVNIMEHHIIAPKPIPDFLNRPNQLFAKEYIFLTLSLFPHHDIIFGLSLYENLFPIVEFIGSLPHSGVLLVDSFSCFDLCFCHICDLFLGHPFDGFLVIFFSLKFGDELPFQALVPVEILVVLQDLMEVFWC